MPGCDAPDPAKRIYEPDWLQFTTPYREDTGQPRKCQRYGVTAELTVNLLMAAEHQRLVNDTPQCTVNEFDRNTTAWCNGWVFENPENTIGTEVPTFRR